MNSLKAIVALALIGFSLSSVAAEVEPVIVHDHTSHAFRGRPFNDREEFQSDYVAGGVLITAGAKRRWQIMITHGVHSIERAPFESASKLTTMYLPRRGR